MAKPAKKPEVIRKFLDHITGVDTEERIRKNMCVTCGNPVTKFKSEICEKEFTISGLCQDCQDKVFKKECPHYTGRYDIGDHELLKNCEHLVISSVVNVFCNENYPDEFLCPHDALSHYCLLVAIVKSVKNWVAKIKGTLTSRKKNAKLTPFAELSKILDGYIDEN